MFVPCQGRSLDCRVKIVALPSKDVLETECSKGVANTPSHAYPKSSANQGMGSHPVILADCGCSSGEGFYRVCMLPEV